MRHQSRTVVGQAKRKQEQLKRAHSEAELLRHVADLHERKGVTWADAQARVGLAFPHTTLHRRLARLHQAGVEGLMDRRHPPPPRLTAEIRGFIEGLGQSDPSLPTRAIRSQIAGRFGVDLSIRRVEEVLQAAGLSRSTLRFKAKSTLPAEGAARSDAPWEERTTREELGGAGLAFLRIASDLTGYGREMAKTVIEVASALPSPVEPIPVDRADRDDKGRFLPEYNATREREDPKVGAVFQSVEDKRVEKDLTRLSIRTTQEETIEKKLLALMALPVVTDQGRFDGVTEPRGEWFQSLGTHDYMPETLAKFARELKWAGVGHALMETHAGLWYGQLEPSLGEEASAVVVYVDSTTKPYWTEIFHRSGRVATVGRVMPCLETALIHTGSGVPLYLKTYAGHSPLVKNVLPLLHEVEAAIGQGMLGRLTVMDAEMSSVALFKQFDSDIDPETGEKGRYFITPLSHAQVKTMDAVSGLNHLDPYRDKDWIGGGSIDLTDSKDRKATPYRARVVVLERRTKETFTAYATNAPAEEYSDEFLMDAYFRRWPAQEHVIRELNGAVAFKAVHGYGKRRVANITVIDKLAKLEVQIDRTTARLKVARADGKEAALVLHRAEVDRRGQQRWEQAECRRQETLAEQDKEHTEAYRSATAAVKHAQGQSAPTELQLEKTRRAHDEVVARIEKLEEALIEKKATLQVLTSRRVIYQTDVELDQIISVLKLGCMLLVQFILHRFFGGLAIEFNTFIREVCALSGARILTPTIETIQLRGNRRNPKLMAHLEQACERVNALNHRRDGRLVRFQVSWPADSPHAK